MNICEAYAALLDPFADGELSPEEMVRVRDHLDGCPACRAYVDDVLAIRTAFPGPEDTEVPEGFAEAVSAAIRAGSAAREKRRAPWIKVFAPLAACCAIVILLAQGPLFRMGGSGTAATNSAASGGSAAPSAPSGGVDTTADDAAPEAEEDGLASTENDSLEDRARKYYADLPQAVMDRNADLEESASMDQGTYYSYGQIDAAPEDREPVAATAPLEEPAGDGTAAPNGDPVFAAVAYLTKDEAGDALAEYEGNPYSRRGVAGTGYALEQADFERILEELDQPFQGQPDPNRTTELCCIVVTD